MFSNNSPKKMIVIGITGGIGCGKSTASGYLQELGFPCIDADKMCHDLYTNKDPALMSAMKQRWGDGVFCADDSPDRKKIADIVFQDPAERKALDGMVRPAAEAELARRMEAQRQSGTNFLLLDVPLLYEADWDRYTDCVIAVWAPAEIQRQRLMHDRGWTDEEVRRRVATQMSADEKLERADYGIINSGNTAFLQHQCAELKDQILHDFEDKLIEKHTR